MKTSRIVAFAAALAVATPALAEKLEDRVARLERTVNNSALIEMVNQNEQLRQTLQALRGEIELLRRDVDQIKQAQQDVAEIKQRQRDLYTDIDRRLRQLETAQPRPVTDAAPGQAPAQSTDGQTEAGTQTSTAAPATAASTPAPAADPAQELADYQAAFALLKAGSYSKAAEAFETFLQQHPEGRYTDNALYWLGETHYVVREFDQAQPYFQRILDEFAASPKRPDAMLKIGFIHFERGELEQSRALLEQISRDFAGTTAAALAEQRLARIRQGQR